MEWPKKIPRILHLYWGRNKPLSYMRAMTVISFLHYNPDWLAVIWCPTEPCLTMPWPTVEHKPREPLVSYGHRDWLLDLERLDRALIVKYSPGDYGFSSDLPEVHRSDILRWGILATSGGMWSDFDIFYQWPINSLNLDEDTDVAVCCFSTGKKFHRVCNRIGFLGSAPETDTWKFFSKVETIARAQADPRSYQSAGRLAMDRVYLSTQKKDHGCKINNLPERRVYPVKPTELYRLYSPNVDLPWRPIGIHWYAGHPESVSKEFATHNGPTGGDEGALVNAMKRMEVGECVTA